MKTWSKLLIITVVLFGFAPPLWSREIVVFSGLDETINWLKKENWWGEEKRGEQLTLPQAMIVAISERWQKNSPSLPDVPRDS